MSYVQDSIMGVLWGHFILQFTTSGILSLWGSWEVESMLVIHASYS